MEQTLALASFVPDESQNLSQIDRAAEKLKRVFTSAVFTRAASTAIASVQAVVQRRQIAHLKSHRIVFEPDVTDNDGASSKVGGGFFSVYRYGKKKKKKTSKGPEAGSPTAAGAVSVQPHELDEELDDDEDDDNDEDEPEAGNSSARISPKRSATFRGPISPSKPPVETGPENMDVELVSCVHPAHSSSNSAPPNVGPDEILVFKRPLSELKSCVTHYVQEADAINFKSILGVDEPERKVPVYGSIGLVITFFDPAKVDEHSPTTPTLACAEQPSPTNPKAPSGEAESKKEEKRKKKLKWGKMNVVQLRFANSTERQFWSRLLQGQHASTILHWLRNPDDEVRRTQAETLRLEDKVRALVAEKHPDVTGLLKQFLSESDHAQGGAVSTTAEAAGGKDQDPPDKGIICLMLNKKEKERKISVTMSLPEGQSAEPKAKSESQPPYLIIGPASSLRDFDVQTLTIPIAGTVLGFTTGQEWTNRFYLEKSIQGSSSPMKQSAGSECSMATIAPSSPILGSSALLTPDQHIPAPSLSSMRLHFVAKSFHQRLKWISWFMSIGIPATKELRRLVYGKETEGVDESEDGKIIRTAGKQSMRMSFRSSKGISNFGSQSSPTGAAAATEAKSDTLSGHPVQGGGKEDNTNSFDGGSSIPVNGEQPEKSTLNGASMSNGTPNNRSTLSMGESAVKNGTFDQGSTISMGKGKDGSTDIKTAQELQPKDGDLLHVPVLFECFALLIRGRPHGSVSDSNPGAAYGKFIVAQCRDILKNQTPQNSDNTASSSTTPAPLTSARVMLDVNLKRRCGAAIGDAFVAQEQIVSFEASSVTLQLCLLLTVPTPEELRLVPRSKMNQYFADTSWVEVSKQDVLAPDTPKTKKPLCPAEVLESCLVTGTILTIQFLDTQNFDESLKVLQTAISMQAHTGS